MKKVMILITALIMTLGMVACGGLSERQVEKMIDEAVEEALQEQEEDKERDSEDKDDDGDEDHDSEDKDDDGYEDHSSDDNDKDDDDNMSYDFMGEEIPKDFPFDDVPIYEGKHAEILGAVKVSSGDDSVFTVGIGTDDEVDDVVDDLENKLKKMYSKSEINVLSMGEMTTFIIDGKDWGISISVGDGEDEGFETYVFYNVASK